MTTDTVSHENDLALQDLRDVALADGKHTCFFNLREFTRGELVAVGSDGNILRWGATGGDEQKWLVVPVDAVGHCRIYTKQNGECMAVGSDGNILRWADTGAESMLFRFVNPQREPDGRLSYNMQVSGPQQFVAVGSNGNVLRWGATGGYTERFVLEPVDVRTPDAAKPARLLFQKKPCRASEEPERPEIKGLDAALAEPEECWVGVDTLPAVFVSDPSYPNRVVQAVEQPYYHLARTRVWEIVKSRGKLKDTVFAPGMVQKDSAEVCRGISRRDMKSVETTIGVVVGAKISGELGATAGKEDEGGGMSGKVSGELNAQFSSQRKELEEHGTEEQETLKETEEVEFTAAEPCRLVLWQLVDRFTLYRSTPSGFAQVGHTCTVYSGRRVWDIHPQLPLKTSTTKVQD